MIWLDEPVAEFFISPTTTFSAPSISSQAQHFFTYHFYLKK